MGARCTFVFKQKEDLAVALYSHWGEYDMHKDLAKALRHAAPRIGGATLMVWLVKRG
jgi:hypothetical protein